MTSQVWLPKSHSSISEQNKEVIKLLHRETEPRSVYNWGKHAVYLRDRGRFVEGKYGAGQEKRRNRGILDRQTGSVACGLGADLSPPHCPTSYGINGMWTSRLTNEIRGPRSRWTSFGRTLLRHIERYCFLAMFQRASALMRFEYSAWIWESLFVKIYTQAQARLRSMKLMSRREVDREGFVS